MFFFFFNDTATTEIYTLSLHDALPISRAPRPRAGHPGRSRARLGGGLAGGVRAGHHQHRPDGPRPAVRAVPEPGAAVGAGRRQDRKSTRLNSSHANISYAVFCLKKKKT